MPPQPPESDGILEVSFQRHPLGGLHAGGQQGNSSPFGTRRKRDPKMGTPCHSLTQHLPLVDPFAKTRRP